MIKNLHIQELDLSSHYAELVTEALLRSIFEAVAQTAQCAYQVKQPFFGKPHIEPIPKTKIDHAQYFKLAMQGEVLVLECDSAAAKQIITQYYVDSHTALPERLHQVAANIAEWLKPQNNEYHATSIIVFLHDMQGLLHICF